MFLPSTPGAKGSPLALAQAMLSRSQNLVPALHAGQLLRCNHADQDGDTSTAVLVALYRLVQKLWANLGINNTTLYASNYQCPLGVLTESV